jgi:hypothetical protein
MTKTYSELIPSVERRLTTRISVYGKQPAGGPPAKRPTITISRQFGCEGFPLAEQLKSLLESRTAEAWTIYDKTLLEQVSQHDHVPPEMLTGLGDPARDVGPFDFLVPGYVPQSHVFEHIPKHIVRLAEMGNAIIVGRGGAIITQKLENCYHFRLVAPLEFRVASIAKRLEMSEAEARAYVRHNERAREAFIEECLRASPADPDHYDAVFNNARQSVTEIAHAIVAYVTEAWRKRVAFEHAAAE